MVVYVQVTPAHPIALRHRTEQRVWMPPKIALLAGQALDHCDQRIQVAPEIFRRSPVAILIVLRHRGNAVRLLNRDIQGQPSYEHASHRVALTGADLSLANH